MQCSCVISRRHRFLTEGESAIKYCRILYASFIGVLPSTVMLEWNRDLSILMVDLRRIQYKNYFVFSSLLPFSHWQYHHAPSLSLPYFRMTNLEMHFPFKDIFPYKSKRCFAILSANNSIPKWVFSKELLAISLECSSHPYFIVTQKCNLKWGKIRLIHLEEISII